MDALWALLGVLGAAALALYLYGLNLGARWAHRHLPGPRPKWLLGNASRRPGLPDQLGEAGKSFLALQRWARRYGGAFVFFMGRQALVVLSGAGPGRWRRVPPCLWALGRARPPCTLE